MGNQIAIGTIPQLGTHTTDLGNQYTLEIFDFICLKPVKYVLFSTQK